MNNLQTAINYSEKTLQGLIKASEILNIKLKTKVIGHRLFITCDNFENMMRLFYKFGYLDAKGEI